MYVLLMVLFVIVSLFLGLFILIQQGKGDMGMGSLGGSAQMLFGGSGGQSFLEKVTWALGAVFILGALGLSVIKSRQITKSRLHGFVSEQKKQAEPVDAAVPTDIQSEGTDAA